jgi:hypothetical protein
MRLQVAGIGIVVAALAAIGCSDRNQPLPAAPRLQAAVSTSDAFTCDFKSLSNLATHYFGSAEAKVVRGLISQMQTAGAFTTAAQDNGFEVMKHIASNIKAGNSDVADASNLTNGLLVCMYDPNTPSGKAALPASFSDTVPAFEDFSVATNPADSGAYDVRGGTSDLTDAVLSRPASGPFSGVSPCSASTCTIAPNTWTGILNANASPKRILVYGEPDLLSSDIYEWRIVPRNTTFSPAALVGFCIPAAAATTSLIHENADLLPFVEQDFVPPCPSRLAAQSSSSQFASRLARWGIDLFGPKPLSATTYLNPGGLAGSTGSIHSLFGPQEVDTVVLTLSGTMTDVVVGQIFPELDIQVTAAGTSTPVPNVQVTVTAINNNGTPAVLQGTVTQTTDATGFLQFKDLSETKTGSYTLVFSGNVGGRGAIAVPQVTSNRFNVRPQ